MAGFGFGNTRPGGVPIIPYRGGMPSVGQWADREQRQLEHSDQMAENQANREQNQAQFDVGTQERLRNFEENHRRMVEARNDALWAQYEAAYQRWQASGRKDEQALNEMKRIQAQLGRMGEFQSDTYMPPPPNTDSGFKGKSMSSDDEPSRGGGITGEG